MGKKAGSRAVSGAFLKEPYRVEGGGAGVARKGLRSLGTTYYGQPGRSRGPGAIVHSSGRGAGSVVRNNVNALNSNTVTGK